MHGLKCGSCRIWQRTDLPSDSNMLHRAAQTCSACKLAEVQIIPLPTLANQILARTFFRSVTLQLACPAVGKFSRASSAGGRLNLQSSNEQPDRVGRRGLFEPREDFSRLTTYAIPLLFPPLKSYNSFPCRLRKINKFMFTNFQPPIRAADTATEIATEIATEMHKCSAVKRSRRAQTVLGDRHDPIYKFYCKCRRPPAELARQNFSTAGYANRFVTDLKNV